MPKDLFMGFPYLNAVETHKPDHITPYYALCFEGNNVVGILHFHTSKISLRENLRFDANDKTIITSLKRLVTRFINIHCTILGSTLITGNYGLHFKDLLDDEKKETLIRLALVELHKIIRSKGQKPGITVVKDFYLFEKVVFDNNNLNFKKFTVQPKLHLPIRPHWINPKAYLDNLKSKYRVRYNKARSLISGLEKKEFSLEDILKHQHTIHDLYHNVSENADFNAFVLHEEYFGSLKKCLGDKCRFFTYWKDGKIIAFYTSIENGDVIDAHFLGYIPQENAQHHLYLNMLYDLVELTINQKKRLLDLSRTAIEIKSTIGAVPQEMKLFIRHENKWMHKLTELILSFVKPNTDYIIRSPFKD
jgi:hypothetical protein